MKILAFSDLHLDVEAAKIILEAADKADLVVGVGDFAQRRQGLEAFMPLFEPIASKAIFTHGNNETESELRAATTVPVLHGQKIERSGITIAGIGGAIPPMPPVAKASVNITEESAVEILGAIEDCDLLLSHSPPFGVADRLDETLANFLQLDISHRMGSTSVRQFIEAKQPKLCLCGHVHSSWGEEGVIGATRVVNLGPTPNWFEL